MSLTKEFGEIVNPQCTNTDAKELKDGRVSFPSGALVSLLSKLCLKRIAAGIGGVGNH